MTIKVSVLISSSSSEKTIDYEIHDVEKYGNHGDYYKIETPTKDYYLPTDRTILEIIYIQ